MKFVWEVQNQILIPPQPFIPSGSQELIMFWSTGKKKK